MLRVKESSDSRPETLSYSSPQEISEPQSNYNSTHPTKIRCFLSHNSLSKHMTSPERPKSQTIKMNQNMLLETPSPDFKHSPIKSKVSIFDASQSKISQSPSFKKRERVEVLRKHHRLSPVKMTITKAVPSIPQSHQAQFGYERRADGIIVKKHLTLNRHKIPVMPVTVVPKLDTFDLIHRDDNVGPGSYDVASTLRTDIGASWGREHLSARDSIYSNLGPGFYKIEVHQESGICDKCIKKSKSMRLYQRLKR